MVVLEFTSSRMCLTVDCSLTGDCVGLVSAVETTERGLRLRDWAESPQPGGCRPNTAPAGLDRPSTAPPRSAQPCSAPSSLWPPCTFTSCAFLAPAARCIFVYAPSVPPLSSPSLVSPFSAFPLFSFSLIFSSLICPLPVFLPLRLFFHPLCLSSFPPLPGTGVVIVPSNY